MHELLWRTVTFIDIPFLVTYAMGLGDTTDQLLDGTRKLEANGYNRADPNGIDLSGFSIDAHLVGYGTNFVPNPPYVLAQVSAIPDRPCRPWLWAARVACFPSATSCDSHRFVALRFC